MSREIKFRVWDGKKMWNDSFLLTSTGRVCAHSRYNEQDEMHICYADVITGQNYITQQFTGFVDKNGKEIYEGDLLEVESFVGLVEVHWDENGGFAPFVWGIDIEFSDPSEFYPKKIKIVGNIFENPELLK